MPEEKIVSQQYIYRGRVVTLRIDNIVLPASGKITTREIVEHGDCVVIVAIDGQGNALLVRQFREAVGKTLLELPAGGINPAEDPADCVRRELQEETGFKPLKVERLAGFYASPGFCTEYMHLFLATGLEPSRLYDEDTESIEVEKVPMERIPQLIADGSIIDAKSIAGLLLAMRRR
ncbi:MAG: MutT/nudix, ADP-ribose pyrophosphatase [Dehalococcoidia bacterium]|nr:MutT/nudix, ADP-ribose pyrophosphatase [Dehalococcoidia bacterium]MBF8304317.1 MutT/nudix, ADP-ribose pyrophosphatase [Dehalococcoidia bacterium]